MRGKAQAVAAIATVLLTAHVSASQPAARYGRLVILPFDIRYGIVLPDEFRRALEQELVTELQRTGLFSEVAAAPDTSTAALSLAVTVTRFNPGSQERRRQIGLGAGTTRLEVHAAFRDERTCAVVLEGDADGRVWGGWLGGDSLGAADGVAKDVAKLAARVPREFPRAAGGPSRRWPGCDAG